MSEKVTTVEGVIGKLGGFLGRSVQDRYFVLKGHLLAYYANQEESKKNNAENVKGALECRCVDTIPHDDPRYQDANQDNKHLRLTLRGPLLKRDYILEFKTVQDRVKWVDAIRHARINSDISRHTLGLAHIQDNSALFFADAVKAARLQLMDTALNLFPFDDPNPEKQAAAAVQGALQAVGNDRANLRVVDLSGTTILHIVCSNSRYPFALVREFIFAGAMLHARDFSGKTLLHVAIEHGRDPEFVKGLIQSGISPLITDSNNENCFHYLAQTKHTAIVEPLLRLLVQATNATFIPARAAATGRDPLEFADFINSVSGNRGRDRSSLLYLAAANQYMTEKELQLLMTYGADPTWSRRNDPVVMEETASMTPEELATDLQYNVSVLSARPDNKLILGKCLDANHTPGAVWYNRIVESSSVSQSGDQKILDSIDLVLENKKRKNEEIQGNNGAREDLSRIASCCNFNTLKTALLRETLVVFNRLIELGADPNSTSPQGDSLQHIACRELNRIAVDRLLDLGIGLRNGKKETNGAIRSKSVVQMRNADLDLTYPIDLVFQSAVAHGRDPMPIWEFLNHLLLRGSPATPHTLAMAITTKKHDVEVFARLSSRVLEFANRNTLAEIAPLIMGSLVFNGGVEKTSQDSHLREKYGPMIDTIVDVTADLCKKGAKLDGVDECGDSRLHGIIIRSARIKPANVAGIVGLFVETAGPRLLFLKNAKGETVIDLVKERTGRLDSTMRVINEVLATTSSSLEELAKKYETENEEAKIRDKKQEQEEEEKSRNVSFANNNNNNNNNTSKPVFVANSSSPSSSPSPIPTLNIVNKNEEEQKEISNETNQKKEEEPSISTSVPEESINNNNSLHEVDADDGPHGNNDVNVRSRAKSTMMTVHHHHHEDQEHNTSEQSNNNNNQNQAHEAPVKRNAAADIDDVDAAEPKREEKAVVDEKKQEKVVEEPKQEQQETGQPDDDSKTDEATEEKVVEEKEVEKQEEVKEENNSTNNNNDVSVETGAGDQNGNETTNPDASEQHQQQQPDSVASPETERDASFPMTQNLQDVD